MNSTEARAALHAAFAAKSDGVLADGAVPCVGLFGDALPDVLLAAIGHGAVDVKMAPETALDQRVSAIEGFIEPFVDDYTRCFLHRLFSGGFNHLKAIVFCREDASAFVAYQYAQELVRQRVVDLVVPDLLLWNFIRRATAAAHQFNLAQAEKLFARLKANFDPDRFDAALGDAAFRADALDQVMALNGAAPCQISGLEVFRWRNAGRYLPAKIHGEMVLAALADLAPAPLVKGHRIALSGSAADSVALYAMIEEFGTIVCDVQPFGAYWPPRSSATAADGLSAFLQECAASGPGLPHQHVAQCVARQCDVVINQLDQNDDSIGWDLPGFKAAVTDKGMTFVDLGFRDLRPSTVWLDGARAKLAADLEGRHV